jgi:hypothetical protein
MILHYPTTKSEHVRDQRRKKHFGTWGDPLVGLAHSLGLAGGVTLLVLLGLLAGLTTLRFFDERRHHDVGGVLSVVVLFVGISFPFVFTRCALRAVRYFVRRREVAKVLRSQPGMIVCDACAGWGVFEQATTLTVYAAPPSNYPKQVTCLSWVPCGGCDGSGVVASRIILMSEREAPQCCLPWAPKYQTSNRYVAGHRA